MSSSRTKDSDFKKPYPAKKEDLRRSVLDTPPIDDSLFKQGYYHPKALGMKVSVPIGNSSSKKQPPLDEDISSNGLNSSPAILRK